MVKELYSWQEFGEDIDEIVEKLKSRVIKIDGIYGLPRGGLPLAVSLSHALDVPLLLDGQACTTNTLIVDDIADTGKSLSYFEEHFIVTLFYHQDSTIKPDIWLRKKTDKWIVFPWENYSA
jgi:hypoxanthine phosphoribosyltransferase